MNKKYINKLYMLCSSLIYINKKYNKASISYSQKDLHRLFNANLEKINYKPIAIRTLQTMLYRLQSMGITTNYCKRLGNYKIRARGSVSYYFVNYSTLEQCKYKISKYFNELVKSKKHSNINFSIKQNGVSKTAPHINNNNCYKSTCSKSALLKEKAKIAIDNENKQLIKKWCNNNEKILKYCINNVKDITSEVIKNGVDIKIALDTCVKQITKTNPDKIRFLSRYYYERKYANDYEKFSKTVINICKEKENQQALLNKYETTEADSDYIVNSITTYVMWNCTWDFAKYDIKYIEEQAIDFVEKKEYKGLTKKQIDDNIHNISTNLLTIIEEAFNVTNIKDTSGI